MKNTKNYKQLKGDRIHSFNIIFIPSDYAAYKRSVTTKTYTFYILYIKHKKKTSIKLNSICDVIQLLDSLNHPCTNLSYKFLSHHKYYEFSRKYFVFPSTMFLFCFVYLQYREGRLLELYIENLYERRI